MCIQNAYGKLYSKKHFRQDLSANPMDTLLSHEATEEDLQMVHAGG